MNPEDIRRIRSLLGWSQERFARELGVSFCTVNRWERGRTRPSPMGLNALKALEARRGPTERRRHLRSSVRRQVAVGRSGQAGPEDPLTGFTEDLSLGGFMFSFDPGAGSAPVSAGDALTFRLLLSGNRWAEVPSVVRWTAAAEGLARAGVMYSPGVSGDTAAMIEAALSE